VTAGAASKVSRPLTRQPDGAGAPVFEVTRHAVVVLYVLAMVHRRLGEHVTDLWVNVAIPTTSASLLTLSLSPPRSTFTEAAVAANAETTLRLVPADRR